MSAKKDKGVKVFLRSLLEDTDNSWFHEVQYVLVGVTLVSVVAVILDSVASLSHWDRWLHAIELFSAIIFSLEYCARIFIAKNPLRYIFSFWGVVDLMTILPAFLHIAGTASLESTRILRLSRLMRMIRMAKIVHAHRRGFRKELRQLDFESYVVALFSSIMLIGTFEYVFEASQNPAYADLPNSMYQAAKLIFGIDFVQPLTSGGRAVMLFGGFLGIALFGLLITTMTPVVSKILLGTTTKDEE